jgi:penicillin-binding protein 1A
MAVPKAPSRWKYKGMKNLTSRAMMALFSLGLVGLITGIGAVVALLYYFGQGLPDYHTLANYQPPIVTRAYASDGRLLAEFAIEKRVYVPIATVPKLVIHAFLSAEDKNFYSHSGIDPVGIFRAAISNLMHHDQRKKGASTITQQVAKNFFLSNEASYTRKIKEAILSFRMEQTFTKDQILELYLNEIFLGAGSYGVAAASLEYFNKPLEELSLEEAAYLAALPKGPNNYNPDRHYDKAVGRRNDIINAMVENGYATKEEAALAKAKPITIIHRDSEQYVNYPYFAEEVRRKLMELYGENGLYEGGLIAHTTMIPAYQKMAEKALRNGLIGYDSRFGLHAEPVAHIDTGDKWAEELGKIPRPSGTGDFELAVILESGDKKATIGLSDGRKGVIPYDKMKWARRGGVTPAKVSDLLKVGDIWLTEAANDKETDPPTYWLRQIPNVQGGMIVMDPHTGRIFAVAGGFSYDMSQFNRATQAIRQPGSSFKPFVYLTGLENGFTPATLLLDAPFVLDQGAGLGTWRPKNYSDDFLGPVPMRVGIEKSRNLMTIRLASYVGMDKVSATARRFGIIDDMPPLLSMAVGAGETTLLRMVTGYSSFVNGGKKVVPTLIDRIQDRGGKTIYVHDKRECLNCGPLIAWSGQPTPEIADNREQIADPRNMYQIVSMLEGVVQRGTGVLMKDLGRPVAGKTGTTNDSKDTWFISFTPDILVGVYIGYDEPKPMGAKETGSRVAVPVVKEFMQAALKDVPPVPFRVPEGIRLVQVNAQTGARAKPGDEKTILEAFVEGTEPSYEPTMFTGHGVNPVSDFGHAGEGEDTGLGGLY